MISGPSDKLEFKAETRKLLDIVAKSLYSDKEVSKNINVYCLPHFVLIKDGRH